MDIRKKNLLKLIGNFLCIVVSVGIFVLLISNAPQGVGGIPYAIFLGPVIFATIIFAIIFLIKTLNNIVNVFRTDQKLEQIEKSKFSIIGKYLFRGIIVILAVYTIYYYYYIFFSS